MKKSIWVSTVVVAIVLVVSIGVVIANKDDDKGAAKEPSKSSSAGKVELLNVSYDPTRELYEAYNQLFASHWKEEKGQSVIVKQSHGGSGKQARSVIDGLQADIVTLALGYDIDEVQKAGLIEQGWEEKLPHHSSPYTSTIVFLVRKDNPKGIHDWEDLIKADIQVITPNPKTSGGARWNYLAAWGYALKANNNSEEKAKEFIKKLYRNVPVLDTGARGATTTFVERGIGDVLIAWENEAYLARKEYGDKFEIITPSLSILAEPPVAVVTKNTGKHNTTEVAEAYLNYLYSEEAQSIIAENFYRPINEKVAEKFAAQFPTLDLVTIRDFGGWDQAQSKHFADGGLFDQLYEAQ